MKAMTPELDDCIRACLDCYRSCAQTFAGHCLEQGGRHVEPTHARLMLGCAEACRTAAALMLQQSPQHAAQCGVCAALCRDCARSCRDLGDMDDCVRACEACADSCERMAAAGLPGQGRTAQAETRAAH